MRTNVDFFKLIDPVGQSLLFILFGYSLDSGISYNMVLLMLAAWQLASWGIHFFFRSVKLLKNERLVWVLCAIIFLPLYYYISRHIPEKFIEVRDPMGLTRYPEHEIMLVAIGLIIAFWYYVICFREVRIIFKKFSADH